MVYKNLRSLRERNGIKQEQMANLLNITRAAYSAYETGKRQVNHETLCTLADFFRVTTDYILGRDVDTFFCNEEEQTIIEKYRTLDERGKQTVCSIVDIEYSRVESKKDIEKGVI